MPSFSTKFFQPFKVVLLLFCLNANCSIVNGQTAKADSLRIDSLPSIPFLPNPLVLNKGGKNIPVVNNKQWQQKRDWIRKQYEYWVSGSVPPAPKTFYSKILSQSIENGVKDEIIEITFGPNDRAKMTVELMIRHLKSRYLFS